MSVVYNATLKTNRMQLVSDLVASKVAAASTGAASAGQLVIGTASLSGATGVLATIPLPTTPFTIAGAGRDPARHAVDGGGIRDRHRRAGGIQEQRGHHDYQRLHGRHVRHRHHLWHHVDHLGRHRVDHLRHHHPRLRT